MTKVPDKYKTSADEEENDILPNLLGLTSKQDINREEFKGFLRAEIILVEQLTDETLFTSKYILDIHKLALQHLYSFAGQLRTVNVSKGGFLFPAAQFLPNAMEAFDKEILNKLPKHYSGKKELIKDIAKVHAELLFIHPFREGNGRLARLLTDLMSLKAGNNYLSLEKIRVERFNEYVMAVQKSADKDYSAMEKIIEDAFDSVH